MRLLQVMVCALPNSYFRTTGIELKRFTIGYGTQHGCLRSDQIFSIIHAHRHIGIYQLPGTHFNGFRTCSSSCINSSIATLTSEDFPQRRGEMRTKTQIIHQRIIHRCII